MPRKKKTGEVKEERYLDDKVVFEEKPDMCPSGVQERDGNTNPSLGAESEKTTARTRARHWFVTIFFEYVSINGIISWITLNCEEAVWQLERGDESGRLHYHFYLNLKKKKLWTTLRDVFSTKANIQVCRNINGAREYVTKEETRHMGPWYFPHAPRRVWNNHPNFENVVLIGRNDFEPCPRVLNWIYCEPGVGKTTYMRYLTTHYPCLVLGVGSVKDYTCAIQLGNYVCVIWDLPKTAAVPEWEIWEELMKGLLFSAKYASGTKEYEAEYFVLLTNHPPRDGYRTDRLNVIQIADIHGTASGGEAVPCKSAVL